MSNGSTTKRRSQRDQRRRLVLLDHENLVGPIRGSARDLRLQDVLGRLRLRPRRDRIIAGASSSETCFEIKQALAGMGCVHLQYGTDGAELAIAANLDPHWAAEKHEELLIASGDHFFLGIAKVFRQLDRRVTVVSHMRSLSIDLRGTADTVLPLSVGTLPLIREVA